MNVNLKYVLQYSIGNSPFTRVVSPVNSDFAIGRKVDKYRNRLSFDSDLVFKNIPKESVFDFDAIKDIEAFNPFSRITIICYKDNVEYIRGYFSVADCDIDNDLCTASVRPQIYDEYNCIYDAWDKEYNIINGVATGDTIRVVNPINLEYCKCSTTISTKYDKVNHPASCYHPFITYIPPNIAYGLPVTNQVNVNPLLGVYGNVGQLIVANSCQITFSNATIIHNTLEVGNYDPLTDEVEYKVTTVWGRESVITFDDINGNALMPVGQGWNYSGAVTYLGAPASKWSRLPFYDLFPNLLYQYYQSVTLCGNRFEFTLKNPYNNDTAYYSDFTRGRRLSDVFTYLLGQTRCGYTIQSQFLFDSLNPISGEPNFSLSIHNCSDVKSYSLSSEPATILLLSLKDLIENLCTLFNLEWIISGDKLIIEHVNYFKNGGTYSNNILITHDLTNIINSQTDKKELLRTDKYSYKVEVEKSELWEMSQYLDFDFSPLRVDYTLVNTYEKQIKTYSSNFITDVAGVLSEPGSFGNQSIVLIAYHPEPITINPIQYANICPVEQGYRSNEDVTNGYLCLSNLFNRFYRYERILLQGDLDNSQEIFFTTINKKTQSISLSDCDMRVVKNDVLVKTNLGVGRIISATHKVVSGMTSIIIEL